VLNDRPYLPASHVDVGCNDSVKRVASQIMLHPVNHRTGLLLFDVPNEDEWWRQLSVTRVSGGTTNTLFRVSGWAAALGAVSKNDDDGDITSWTLSVVVRVFGAEGMIDRDIENATYAALAESKIAPPYFGRFANGRIEGWMDGFRHLEVNEMSIPSIAVGTAAALAKMHAQFHVPDNLQDYYPLDKPSLWTQLEDWINKAISSTFKTDHDTKRAEALHLAAIGEEINWLMTAIPSDAIVVFCHNDLLSANILCDLSGTIQLIDFEYGGANYRSFDIANHFCEYAGGPPVDPNPKYECLPDETAQRIFMQSYLGTACGKLPDDEAVDKMLLEVKGFMLASHLYWGVWAANQAATEGCENFDYMLYSLNRFKQYWSAKGEWCSKSAKAT
jgi:ethanolamine kinase